MRSSQFFNAFHGAGLWGMEDYLTACLAALMTCEPQLKDAFVAWLDEHASHRLRGRRWDVIGQRSYPTDRFGAAIIDMVLESDDLILWCEHKVDAPEGKRTAKTDRTEVIGQLQKYDLARQKAQEDTKRPILIFLIAAKGVGLDRDRVGLVAETAGTGGFVYCGKGGALRWANFYPRLRSVATACASSSGTDFGSQLLSGFTDWWGAQPALRDLPSQSDLFPNDLSERAPLWVVAVDWLRTATRLKFTGAGTYGGQSIEIRSSLPEVTYFECLPILPGNVDGWVESLPSALFRVSIKVTAPPCAPPTWHHPDGDDWPILQIHDEAGKGGVTMLRYYIGVPKWDSLDTTELRQRAVRRVVQLAVGCLRSTVGIDIERSSG